jgi:nitrate reductase assembly molybdenum cofactor insertion protein NarJ
MARPKAVAGELVLLQTRVPLFDGAALDALARATGEAKASHLRRALARYLATFDLTAHTTTSVVTHPITKEKAR